MKLSKNTINVLKNFALINPGIYLREGNTILTSAPSNAIYGEYVLPDEEVLNFDVALYDLNGFLNILSLSGEESDIIQSSDLTELLITNKRSKIHWPAVEPATIKYPKKQINFPQGVVTFDLSAEDFSQLMKISRGLGADTIAICSDSGKLVIKSYNKTVDLKMEKPLSVFDIAEVDPSLEFNFVIYLQNAKMMNDNYKVHLWAKGVNFAAKFEGEVCSYVLAVEKESSHNF